MEESRMDLAQIALWQIANSKIGEQTYLHWEELKAIKGIAKEALVKINPLAGDFFARNKDSF